MTEPSPTDPNRFEQSGYTIQFTDDAVAFANTRTFVPLLTTFIGVVASIGLTVLAVLLVFDPEQNASAAIGAGVLAIVATTVTVFSWSRYTEQRKQGFKETITHRLTPEALFDDRGSRLAAASDLELEVAHDPLQQVGTRTYNLELSYGMTVVTVFKTTDKELARDIAQRIRAFSAIESND